jgi:hypothetical protein
MSVKVRPVLIVCLLAVAAVATSVAVATNHEATASGAMTADRCCFTNPRYSGVCEVTPGPEESCASVLGYLNNPNSSGKAYCGGTTVRGGWSQVTCDE